jgi:opacity protein-like surface antigen
MSVWDGKDEVMRRPRVLALLGAVALCLGGATAATAAKTPTRTPSASGSGALDNGARQFSFNAKQNADGTVTGQAELTNKDFTGANGTSPYKLHVDISCMKVVGNIAIFGGTTKRTNDPSLVDAVFFSVQDNGEPGKGADKISRAFFWDDDPATTGDPQSCQLVPFEGPDSFPLETIETGNVQVKQ